MNYRQIFAMTLVVLVQACGLPSTKAISQPISGGSNTQITSNSSPTSTPTPSNHSSTGNSSTDNKSLEVDKQSKANLPLSCSKEEYQSFFEQFVRGKDHQGNEIRYTFTSPYIQVRDYQDPSNLIETMSRKNDEFSIDIRDYQWVQLVPSEVDNSPYTRLKIDIQKIDDKTFRVNYIKSQYKYEDNRNTQEEVLVKTYGQPNAYIFEHRNGCWYLTQKLQSSLRSQGEPATATQTNNQTQLASILSNQMAYAEARNRLLSSGWLPLSNSNCKSNVGGKADICDQIPELESCSGDGYCLMNFADQSQGLNLSITTYGDYRDWNIKGQASKLRVQQWALVKKN